MTTKKKSNKTGPTKGGAKKGGPIIAGAPIIIGGGGGKKRRERILYCEFDELHFPKRTPGASPGKKWFRSDVLCLQTLTLQVGATTLDFSSLLPANGDCKIEIKGRGNDEEILVHGNNTDANDNKMGIKFHIGKYLPEARVRRRHSSDDVDNYVRILKIETPNWYFDRRFSRGEPWKLIGVSYDPSVKAQSKRRV